MLRLPSTLFATIVAVAGFIVALPRARAQGAAPAITVSASSLSGSWVNVTDPVTFTASGGSGSGHYVWSGAVSGTGATATQTFAAPGVYSASVYWLPDGGSASGIATATLNVSALVNLSAISFAPNAPPTISTTQPLSSTFMLRAKFTNGPITQQAANQRNINWAILDSLPAAGTYTVALYWLQYDSTGQNLLQIGPMQYVTANVTGPQTTAVSISASAATLSGQWVNVGDPVTFTASGGSSGGPYVWTGAASGTGPSVTRTFNVPGDYVVNAYASGTAAYAPSPVTSFTLHVSALVNISALTFSANNPPTVTCTQPLKPGYKLRAKYYNGSTTVQAANQWNLSSVTLDTLPPPGSYTLYLYWVQYDGTETVLQQIGPMQTFNAVVTGAAGQSGVTISASASSLSGQWVNVGDPVTFNASGGSGTGSFVWSGAVSGTGASVTQSFAAPGDYTVSLVRAGDSTYAQSNAASMTVHVSALVSLSSLNFSANNVPSVSTSQPLLSSFVLRAKFYNSSVNMQTATQLNVNPAVLNNVPPPGTYTVALYWLQYDSSGTNLQQIGPIQYLTATVAQSAPAITSPATASATTNAAFSYQITGTNGPTSFGASGLPPGLSVNSVGAITGTPTSNGTYNVVLTAGNSGGVGSATLTITVAAPGPSGVPVSVLSQMGDATSAQADTSNSINLQVLVPQNP